MSRIVKVEVGRFDYSFVGAFKFFPADTDGIVRRPSVLLRLTDEAANQGWGQAVPVPTWTYETRESVETTLRNYLAPAILGADSEDLIEIHRRMNYAIRPGFSTGMPLSKAAVDLACFDLNGKISGKRVAELLGGARLSKIRLNWTLNAPTLGEAEKQMEQARQKGYQNFNIKIGPPQSPEYDVELVRLVRKSFPGTFLWTDANTGYSLETALEVLPRLADEGVQVVESPLPPNRIRGYQALKRLGAVPIYMDEGIISPVEFEEFIALEMLDGVTLKPARCGGLWTSRRIVELAREHGLGVLGSGLTDPDLSLAAALHLYSWAGIDQPCALNGPQFLGDSLAGDQLRPDGDILRLPDSPGLGLTLDHRAEACLDVAAEA